ncbi:MAG: hypothetical protein WKF41_19470 [Gaiellaceae bacterium]
MATSKLPEQSSVACKRETWHFWHGTPELFAHIVRTAERATSVVDSATTTVIDVCIADDHETFDSPASFTELVTIDALRHFTSMSAVVTAGASRSEIVLRWTRPWWAIGVGKDADVVLEVRGTDGEVEARHMLIRRAILRGGTQREAIQVVMAFLLAGAGGTAAAALVLSGGYLLGVGGSETLLAALSVGGIGWILGVYWGTWAYPSIEVAPIGQTNLRRLVRVVGPVLLTVILAGITKKLFG